MNPVTIVLSAVFAVVVAIVLVGAILSIASSDEIDTRGTDGPVGFGKTTDLAEQVAKDGPILIPDQSDARRRDIIIQHLEEDPDEGWVVIAARPPGEERDCTLEWQATEQRFEDCKGRSYPIDGGDQPRYTSRVEDGRLIVEFPKPD